MSTYQPGPDDLPTPFDRYRIVRRLGRGGMGAVYLADDPRLDRPVALKVPFLGTAADPAAVERLRREACALAPLHHPNLCAVYDASVWDGIPYLTMRYVEGEALRQRLGTYGGREAVTLVAMLARALAVVHEAGVIHCDLKPENVIIDARGQPVIVDFGLAVSGRADRTPASAPGTVQGTLAYMAPEQQESGRDALGPGCDVFALGVMLYELLAGRLPFEGGFFEVLKQKRGEQFTPLSEFRVDPALEAICHQALCQDPAARFAGMSEFADRLTAYLNEEAAAGPAAPTEARGQDAVSTMHPVDPRVAEEVLQLLREWGWDVGLTRLEAILESVADLRRRGLLRLLAGWIKGQRGEHQAARAHLEAAEQVPTLKAWARLGQAFLHYREDRLAEAWALLDQAERGAACDPVLRAAINHGRGTIRYRQGHDDEALDYLFAAAERCGPDQFGHGRVLDTLGMVYAAKNNFPAAHALYRKALAVKTAQHDLLGLALTHGQLGRLLLDWGDLDGAEREFRADLVVCRQTNDSRGEAQMYDHLGQVLLARGQAERALEYLNESVTRNQAGGWTANEAYARKDRARVLLELKRDAEAECDARAAEGLSGNRPEVAFHARRALALALAAQGRLGEAEPLLNQAAAFFRDQKEPAEAARTWLELARVQRRRTGSLATVRESLQFALEQADRSRRDVLVGVIEQELAKVDQEELYRRAYRRARGTGIPDDIGSLSAVQGDKATILFLDLRNFTGMSLTQDPRVVQMTLNQIFAELAVVVERHDITVNQYLGDGFMALVRDRDHAHRAVAGALEMQAAVAAFNRPRRLLGGEPLLEARIGVATGDVVFGNIGTYRKLDFTAVGPTTNLAARLQGESRPGKVCINEEAFKRVRDEFMFEEEGGRAATLKGVGEVRVWDVVGRKGAVPVAAVALAAQRS